MGRPVGSKNKARTASWNELISIRGGSVDDELDIEGTGIDEDDEDYDADDDDDEKVAEKVKRVRVAANTLPPTQKTQLMFGLPAGLKAVIEEAASKEEVASGALIRDLIAKHFGYELPPEAARGARKRYNSEEEKLAAQQAATKKRNATVRELVKRYNSGDIQLPADVRAMLESLGTPEPVVAKSEGESEGEQDGVEVTVGEDGELVGASA